MTREELLDRMTIEEFQMWVTLNQLEPFGEYGEWLRTGLICSTLANIHRGKDQPLFTPQNFMPEAFAPKKKPQSMKERWMAVMEAQNAIMNARTRGNA